MTNKKGWQTMGLTTGSRLWATADLASLQSKAIVPFSLALGGQLSTPHRRAAAMSSRYGRNAVLLKRLALICVFVLISELFVYNLVTCLDASVAWATTTSPHLIFDCLLVACPVLWGVWYARAKKNPLGQPWWGALTLVASGAFVMLFRTLPFEEQARQAHVRANEKLTTDLAKFASAKPLLKWEKRFTFLVFATVRHLAKFDPRPFPLPDAVSAAPQTQLQAPRKVNPSHPAFMVALPSVFRLTAWPELAQALSGQQVKTALLLYKWSALHASAPHSVRLTTNLWKGHKLPRATFLSKGVTILSLSAAPTTAPASYPGSFIGGGVKAPVYLMQPRHQRQGGFSLMQHGTPTLTQAWFARPSAKK